MLILFSLIVMRMSGAVLFSPVFGRRNVPSSVKAAFIMTFSLMLYMGTGGVLLHAPGTLLEYGVMLIKELAMGCVLGFGMELAVMTVRYASSIMDFSMGLNMAQIYDPEFNTQMTITSGMYYAFLMLLFLSVNGHLRLVAIFFGSAMQIPFGQVSLGPELCVAVLDMFQQSIAMGLQFAFPIIAMELVTEVAVGILMRMIPQINVFVVNFQIKLIVGLLMLLFLFSPFSDKLNLIIARLFTSLDYLVVLMRPAGSAP